MKKFLSFLIFGHIAFSCLGGIGLAYAETQAEADARVAAFEESSRQDAEDALDESYANDAANAAANAANPATPNPCAVSQADIAGGKSVSEMLKNCKPNGVITTESTDSKDFKLAWGARERVVEIANQIILAGSILAVGAIVYAAILYIIAAGDDERIKQAKSSLKFGIIGFVMMLLSFPLVNAIIRLFYSTSS